MNNKLLFPDFENIIVAGEIPTAIEDGYSYLEQVMALRKYVLSLGEYTKDLTDNVNNNTDEISNLKAFKHITHLGTREGEILKLEELKDDLYITDYKIFIEYKQGFVFSYEKGALLTKTSGTPSKEEYSKLDNVIEHSVTGYGSGILATGYNIINTETEENLDSNLTTMDIINITETVLNNFNDIKDLQSEVTNISNSIINIDNILNNSSQIENLSESANLWELNDGIYKATKNLEITISSDTSVSKEPISIGQIIMVQSSNNDEWEMWYTVGTNIMYGQTYLDDGVYTGSRQSINVRTLTSKVESLETRVTNLEQAPKDESIFIEFNEGTDTIIPKLQVFIDNFRKGIVTPIYWYYTSGDLIQLSKIVNGLDNTAGRRMNLYFTAFDSTTLSNKQIPVGYMLLNLDLSTYNITNITKNWEYQTIGGNDSKIYVIKKSDTLSTQRQVAQEWFTDYLETGTLNLFYNNGSYNFPLSYLNKSTQNLSVHFFGMTTAASQGKYNYYYYGAQSALGIWNYSGSNLTSYNEPNYSYQDIQAYIPNTLPLPTNNTTSYTPTGDYNPATKKYVDDAVKSAGGEINSYIFDMTGNITPVLSDNDKTMVDNIINDYTNNTPFISYLYHKDNHNQKDTYMLLNVYKYSTSKYNLLYKDTYLEDASGTTLGEFYIFITKDGSEYNIEQKYYYNTPQPAGHQTINIYSSDTTDQIKTKLQTLNGNNYISGNLDDENNKQYKFIKIENDIDAMANLYYFEKDEVVNGKLKITTIIFTLNEMTDTLTKQTIISYLPNEEITSTKKFSFDFLFSDDTTDSVSSYNSSSYIMTGISKSFDVNEIYGELMVKYSEVISGSTYSSVCPADRLKYMLTNVSDVDYSFRTLSDGTSQLTLFIRRTDETQAFTSPSGLKIENIFINGYFLNSTEDVSKSTTIEKN